MARGDEEAFSKLPRVIIETSTPAQAKWRAEVLAAKDAITDRTPAALAKTYELLRAERDRLEEEAKKAARPNNAQIAALEELIPEAFAAGGVDSLRTVGGHHVGTSPDIQTKVLDNDKLIAWVKANGYERKLTLYAPTVLSITKERVRDGETVPDGVDVRGYDKVSFTKAS